VKIAEEFGGEIVNCDSIQIYRGLDIGSAKLSTAERKSIPHHLLDVADLDETITAGEYARRARVVLKELRERHVLPVVAGGTGFYLRALLDGLSPAASRNTEIRRRLERVAERHAEALHRFLRRYDRHAARRIHPNDLQKLIRAVELMQVERRPVSETQGRPRTKLQGYKTLKIGLDPPRRELHEKINLRSERMFARGLVEETADLLRTYPPDVKPLGSLGYKQAVRVIEGQMTREQAIQECQTKTRQYAKRQMTWFRGEKDTVWLRGFGDDPVIQERALSCTRDFLSGC
jgi:tRNA dimethylallyltransferase